MVVAPGTPSSAGQSVSWYELGAKVAAGMVGYCKAVEHAEGRVGSLVHAAWCWMLGVMKPSFLLSGR